MPSSDSRNIARAIARTSDQAARATAANRRGNVVSVNVDGSAVVQLPGGAKIKLPQSNLFEYSVNEPVVITKSGNIWEPQGPSAYGGGSGAPFVTP